MAQFEKSPKAQPSTNFTSLSAVGLGGERAIDSTLETSQRLERLRTDLEKNVKPGQDNRHSAVVSSVINAFRGSKLDPTATEIDKILNKGSAILDPTEVKLVQIAAHLASHWPSLSAKDIADLTSDVMHRASTTQAPIGKPPTKREKVYGIEMDVPVNMGAPENVLRHNWGPGRPHRAAFEKCVQIAFPEKYPSGKPVFAP